MNYVLWRRTGVAAAGFRRPSCCEGHRKRFARYMFGDLDLYKDQDFFDENSTGTLILPDKSYNLEIFACLLIDAGEDSIFDPEQWQTDIDGLLAFARTNSVHLRGETLAKLEQTETPKILALSTCSSEFTDARTVILAMMEPYQILEQEENES